MLPVQCMQIIKYTLDEPVVAIVSHILAESCMAVNYISVQHFKLAECLSSLGDGSCMKL